MAADYASFFFFLAEVTGFWKEEKETQNEAYFNDDDIRKWPIDVMKCPGKCNDTFITQNVNSYDVGRIYSEVLFFCCCCFYS